MIMIEDKQWCVYVHLTGEQIFYVGVGVSTRPFERIKRNHLWNAHVSENPAFAVRIEVWTNDRREALRHETALIRLHRPPCNQLMNGYTNAERNKLIGNVHAGKEISQQTRQKISAARKGRPNGWLGRKHTDETKAKIRGLRDSHPIRCLESGAEYPSIRSAAIALQIAKTSLRAHLRGDVPHVQGMTFVRAGLCALVAGAAKERSGQSEDEGKRADER